MRKKQLDEIDKKNRKQEEYFEELTSKIGQVEPEKVMKEMQSLGWNMAIFDARERQKRYEDIEKLCPNMIDRFLIEHTLTFMVIH